MHEAATVAVGGLHSRYHSARVYPSARKGRKPTEPPKGRDTVDPRVKIMAANLLDYSLEIKPGEKLLIEAVTGSEPLVLALLESSYEREALPFVNLHDQRIQRGWLLGALTEQMRVRAGWWVREMEECDAHLFIDAGNNASELADVPPATTECYRRVMEPVFDVSLKKKWCSLNFPTPAAAQAAGMSSQAFEDFTFAVCALDYARMDRAMDPLIELMTRTDEVRIVGPGTDLSFSIKGIPVVKAAGKNNIPDGEVFTAPVRESANGRIRFNTPTLLEGCTYTDVELALQSGRIVEVGGPDAARVGAVLDSDEGARYLGEFALGVNPLIEKPIKDVLYDEKISGSLHLTPGRAYDEADNGNRSCVHWDLVLMQSPAYGGGEIWFDGVLVRKNGSFVPGELQGLNPENLM
jgi:aminopeptidase